MSSPPARPGSLRPLMALGLVAFFGAGALQASYGPSFVALQARYAVGVAEVGGSVAAHFLGAFLGVIVSGALLARAGYRPLLVSASALMGAGGFAIALAPTWSLALMGAGVIGFGYGLAVALYNFLFARAFAHRGAAAVNLINAAFGLGSVASPALVAAATGALAARGPEGVALVTPLAFGFLALLAFAVAAMAARLPWLPPPLAAGAAAHGRLPLAATTLFATLFFVYVAVEASTAAWAPTHLLGQVGPARAALAASVFWVAMTLGRFAAAIVGGRVRPGDLVAASVVIGIGGLALAQAPGLALLGYGVAGLGLGPVFPTSVAWVQRRFGDQTERVGPVVLAAGNLGPVLGAPAVGVAVAATGPEAIPTVLVLVLLLLAAVVAAAWTTSRRHEAASAA